MKASSPFEREEAHEKKKQSDYSTLSLRALPGLKTGTFFAGILMVSPVAGLRPVRALRFTTTSLPSPGRVNPVLASLYAISFISSRTAATSFLVRPVLSAVSALRGGCGECPRVVRSGRSNKKSASRRRRTYGSRAGRQRPVHDADCPRWRPAISSCRTAAEPWRDPPRVGR